MLNEHQTLLFLSQILVLLASARALGALARRCGQPSVVGELAAGVLLGPSVLGKLAPAAFAALFPADPVQRGALGAVAWFGVLLLLIATGFETDLRLLRRLGRATARVALGSLLLPACVGFALGMAMPDVFVGERATRPLFALLMATALSISALPVIAAVLSQLGLMRRSIAQMILSAAMLDDLVGWISLGIVASLAQSGSVQARPLLVAISGLTLFLLFAFTVGQRAVDFALRRVRESRADSGAAFTVTVLTGIAGGAITHAIGLEAIFGAFIAGIVLGRSKFQQEETFVLLQRVSGALLAPIFFATAGLRVDLGQLASPHVAGWGLLVLAAATVSKFGGAYLGGTLAGLPTREKIALGAGLNARGAVEIVLATVGLSLGVLNASSYAVVVLMALATSMAAPPILSRALRGWRGSEEEQERLERERLLEDAVLVGPRRVLLPSHGGPNSMLAARIVDLAWPQESEVTILSAGIDVPAQDLAKVRSAFAKRPVLHEHHGALAPLDAILKQAPLGYGAIAVGATDLHVAGRLVSPVIDALLGASPLPVVMVRAGARENPDKASSYRRVLVPAIGTAPGQAALEIGCRVAQRSGAEVLIAHVVTSPPRGRRGIYPFWNESAPLQLDAQRSDVAERVVEAARDFAAQMGVRAEAVIRSGPSVPQEILALAHERDVDLLVVAANLRQLSGRPFLGHGVEDLLEEAEATLVVVTAPPGWHR